ncbi:MAG: protein translocase subunit SecF [Candidatus Cloacimonadota bacterium]|nr:MAG: protein translocase subunit SecF [Candidatus Cloacimonadota bacterium]PIE77608.1 MAG: protein translocase subunit SecF [Candidatus Delongbacteria bacterium]
MLTDKQIDFVGKRKIAMITSLLVIVVSMVFVIIRGGLDYNIEFNGGYLVQVALAEDQSIGEIRENFTASGLKGFELQEFSDTVQDDNYKKEIVIKIETSDENTDDLEEAVVSTLDKSYGKGSYLIRQSSTIGPKIGEELKSSAVYAIIFASIGILLYITLKFQFRYGVAAIIAVLHDVLVTLGLFSILGSVLNIEVSLAVIAALLTIVGYSLNDTIVVFDRIRENRNNMEDMNFEPLVNLSINETLRRTLLTSLTTLFVVLILFIFGGEVIRDLSTALLLGVIVGTYSSIFIASPIVIAWDNYTKRKK